jgi:signal transduction histidine kinase
MFLRPRIPVLTINLETHSNPDLRIDEKELRQLLPNLVRNGFEAMPSGGAVTIKADHKNDEIQLVVQDTGPGVPQEILDRLGTSFLTTKENGTGLAMCYRIAQRHGAKIDVKTLGKGPAFFVKFKVEPE